MPSQQQEAYLYKAATAAVRAIDSTLAAVCAPVVGSWLGFLPPVTPVTGGMIKI